eukprot:TRINITY_DN37324_c0_g1_i10.p1 TRINITY_DN37324_c0_g1~~TRINITY_DN37324_c0_g1_i10.p1  ORF type:complete len:209 (-),score=69.02 TRINITY_DN37324_c0_g1_i10:326-952(-)
MIESSMTVVGQCKDSCTDSDSQLVDSYSDIYSQQFENSLEIDTTSGTVVDEENWFTRPRQNPDARTPNIRKANRVRFNEADELASDRDGVISISYKQLGEKIGGKDSQCSEWDNPFQPEGYLSQDADRMVTMWKEGTIGQEYSREYETDTEDDNYEAVKDTLENISDENPQVSGNILPRKPPILDISTVDMLDKSSDNEKMQANCCVL